MIFFASIFIWLCSLGLINIKIVLTYCEKMFCKFCKFLAFSLEFQKFFSITRTIFSHSRTENFWQQNTISALTMTRVKKITCFFGDSQVSGCMLSIDHGAALRERPGCMIQGKKAVGVRLCACAIAAHAPRQRRAHAIACFERAPCAFLGALKTPYTWGGVLFRPLGHFEPI